MNILPVSNQLTEAQVATHWILGAKAAVLDRPPLEEHKECVYYMDGYKMIKSQKLIAPGDNHAELLNQMLLAISNGKSFFS